jgi:hypothetical protein
MTPDKLRADAARVMRQTLAGMLRGKQFCDYDVTRWLQQHILSDRAALQHSSIRNKQ